LLAQADALVAQAQEIFTPFEQQPLEAMEHPPLLYASFMLLPSSFRLSASF
jgi:hypothetical protein